LILTVSNQNLKAGDKSPEDLEWVLWFMMWVLLASPEKISSTEAHQQRRILLERKYAAPLSLFEIKGIPLARYLVSLLLPLPFLLGSRFRTLILAFFAHGCFSLYFSHNKYPPFKIGY
jgi:hypothetical protein